MPDSTPPLPKTLGTLLQQSLQDPTNYLNLLFALAGGPGNLFSNTTLVEFDNGRSSPSITGSNQSEESGTNAVAIAAEAVGAALLVAGVILY